MRGAFGNAGEIGHIVVAPGGRPCPCGQHGCLERYASLHALRERLRAAGTLADLEDLERRCTPEADPVVDAWLDEAAAHLSPMVAMLENILDPQTIILAGGLPRPTDSTRSSRGCASPPASRAAATAPCPGSSAARPAPSPPRSAPPPCRCTRRSRRGWT